MKNKIASEPSGRLSPLPPALKTFVGVAALLLETAIVAVLFFGGTLHYGPPYDSPVLHEHYPDLINLLPRFQHLHTIQFFTDQVDAPFMYPAPVAVCYRLFYLAVPHELAAFFCFVLLTALSAAFLFGRALIRKGFGTVRTITFLIFVLLTSFPLWVELKQANMEICSWLLLALGIWFLLRERGYSAAACFGLAGALKITPFFYLGIFLARRQYRQLLVAVLSAAAATVPSLWLIYPHIAESWRQTNLSISHFRTVVTLRIYPQLAFDHSLFGLVKRALYWHINSRHLSMLLTVYTAFASATLLILFFGWIRKLPLANQILCLCVATLVVPPTSFDYTLMSLYLPWSVLALLAVQDQKSGRSTPGLVAAMVCFAILFVPETEFIARHQSVGGQIKAVTLLALFAIGLRYRFPLVNPEGLP